MNRWIGLVSLTLGLLIAPAHATSGRIQAVTVYPDRAEIRREVEIDLVAGVHQLQFTGLPATLQREQLRIAAEGVEGLILGAVETRLVRGLDSVSDRARELEARIERAGDQRRAIENRLEALALQIRLLESLTQPVAEPGPAAANPAQLLAFVGQGASEVLSARLAGEQELRGVDRELERLRRELTDLGKIQRDRLDIQIDYRSSASGRARFILEYLVPAAGWRPVYELRLDSAVGRLDIEQRAEIIQDTGEDWDGVELTVALAQPALGGRLVELSTWHIDVLKPAAFEARRALPAADSALLASAEPIAEASQVALVGGAFAAAYRVPGQARIMAGNQPVRVDLARHRLDGRLSVRAVPSQQRHAFLFFEGENPSAVALPAGRATLFQDHVLVGETRLTSIVPGGRLALSFGVDPNIEIDYRPIVDRRGTEGLIRRQQTAERQFEIEISNRHRMAMAVSIDDRMPVARDERIRIELTPATDAPTERDVDGRPGVLRWTRGLAPGQTWVITFGYRASFPTDIEDVIGW